MSTYMEEYKSKLITPAQAARLVPSNSIVDYGAFACKPIDFDVALGERAGEEGLENVSVRFIGTVLPVPQVLLKDPEQKTFQCFSWYFTALDRKAGDFGLVAHLPFNYHEATMMAYNPEYQRIWPDVWVCQTTPMDSSGCFNFGLGNSHLRGIALGAKTVIVEVNENMPLCLGGSDEYVHISEIDHIIEGSNSPIFALPELPEATEAEKKIAELIVSEIHDGSCIQLGIGSLPNMIGTLIADSDLKDLGVQSEMFCDAYVKMYNAGKITNAKKARDINKSAFSFCLGTQETYDFINGNPRCASYTVDYTNNPANIALNEKMVAINNIMEVDLLSQVCSESSGLRQISGTGGQLDFVLGAFHSKGGKSILAFTSTFKDKEGKMHSRIRPLLSPGSVVTIPRTVVNYLATEFGLVNLKALSVWGRAEALVNIAHPDFRDDLIDSAKEMKLWSKTNRIPF